MTLEEKYKITSNEFVDVFIEYNRNLELLKLFPGETTHIINTRYAIAYVPADILTTDFIQTYGFDVLPKCYGLTSEISLETTGVQKLRRIPAFDLRGSGVLVAVIDTGIDYTNPIFLHEDGTSKIISIWDQTIDSEDQYPGESFYGTEYNLEQINAAIQSEDPRSIVPSVDEIGHGTMLAGVIAGSEVASEGFSGVVPDADIIVVKLKQAKQNIRDFLIIPSDVPCYQENDIKWGVTYIIDKVNQLQRPCAVCIGLGTSQGAHDASGPLNGLLYFAGNFSGFTFSVSAGNEGASKGHFFSTIDPTVGSSTVELKVGENEPGFSMELWGEVPNFYSIDLLSPSGEYIPRITASLGTSREIPFIFEKTTISINYQLFESQTGDQLILMRFRDPSPGVWRIQVYSQEDIEGSFHVWLPMNHFISEDTYFINADPDTTITSPGNAIYPITATAYDPNANALYIKASKGYTTNNVVKPELAAPGVNVVVPNLEQGFSTASGTGLAAAHTAGITAIMLEWGIVKGFQSDIDSKDIKKYLIRGAKRDNFQEYPNQNWGYGKIDIYNVFSILRTNFPKA